MELTDFQATGLSMEDFSGLSLPKSGMSLNRRTTSQIAAASSIAQFQNDMSSFRFWRDSLATRQGREDYLLNGSLKTSASDYYKGNFTEIMANPELPDEDKAAVLSTVTGATPDTNMSTLDVLAQEMYLVDDADESEEAFDSRSMMVDIISEVNDIKKQQQAIINGYRMGQDQSTLDMVADLGELMVPMAEWIQIDQLAREFGVPYSDAILMGEQKQALYELIEKVPMDQKLDFTRKVLDVISNNDTVVFSDGNILSSLEVLERMTVDNDYSDAGRWFDNIISVLDVIGVGTLLASAAKTPARAAKISRLQREAQLFRGTPEPRAEEVFTRPDDTLELTEEMRVPTALEVEARSFTPEVQTTAPDLEAEAKAWMTRTEVDPASPAQVFKETSPNAARGAHTSVALDTTDEAAEALYGTTKTEALAHDLLPEVDTRSVVPNKVVHDGPYYEQPKPLRQIQERDGNAYLTGREIKTVREKVIRGLENVEGMVPHKESLIIRLNDDGTTTFRMAYRPVDSGFKTADRAMENAMYAFRDYGLTEKEIVLLQRTKDGWVPTTQKELAAKAELRAAFTKAKKKIPAELKELDYAVAIDYNYKFTPSDLDIWDRLYPKNNLLDRLPPMMARTNSGSLTQHLVDPNSVMPPQIVEPASALLDRSVAMKKLFVETFNEGVIQPINKMKKDRRAMVEEYIKEANLREIKFDLVDLRARGFNSEEIEVLKEWRRANDALWHAANSDVAQTLRNRGFKIYTDNQNNHLVVKPISRNQVGANTWFYDPITDVVENLRPEGLDDFYAKGGTFARLSEPMQINGEWIDTIKVANTPERGYLRGVRTDEKVLAYRDGYYPVMYDANWFLTKVVKGRNGQEFRKTVASAQREADILHAQKQLQATEPDAVFEARRDRRNNIQRYSQMAEDGWDIAVASGMSMQRVRGERLVDAGVDLHKAGHSNLLDPMEAVKIQINQLSQRVVLRTYLDSVKQRWINNYFDELGLKPNKFGEKWFPDNIAQIERNPGVKQKTVADARSIFNYVHHLENSYINYIDETWRATLNYFAETLDTLGWAKASTALQSVSRSSPSSVSKGAAFKLYLAANPARQLIIQGHQSVQLQAINPRYFYGPLQWDIYRVNKVMRGDRSDPDAVLMYEEIVKSGILEAVDANNLVRQDTLQLAARTNTQKILNVANKPLEVSQKYGFDIGEQTVLVTSWLTHYDAKIKEVGRKTLTRRELDQVAGKARAFTYNMNRAGDMPYNQNSLAIIAQFLQVPHKALLQMFTNRALTKRQRAQLIAFNTIMYGVPTGLITYTGLKPGPERDMIEAGLEDVLLNGIATWATGEEQQVDFGDLAPTNAYGLYDMVTTMATTDIFTLIKDSPSGSLIFGQNPRLTEAFKTGARYFNLIDDYDDPELDTKFTDVATATLQIFSGASNAFKARYAAQTDQKISSLGNLTDSDVTDFEAAMQFFGFRTKTETGSQEIRQIMYGDKDFTTTDVTLWYTELKRHLARRGMTVRERDISQRAISEAWRVFELDESRARETILNLLAADVKEGNLTIYEDVLKQMGIKSPNEVRDMISRLPPSKERDTLIRSVDIYENGLENARSVQEELNLQRGN